MFANTQQTDDGRNAKTKLKLMSLLILQSQW
jgi:hypothetical protein